MLKSNSCLLLVGLLACSSVHAQIFQRELGDFDLKLGTTPSRSMAQGLVKPAAVGSFHGGLDLSHDSGLYDWDYLYELAHGYDTMWADYLARLEAAGASRHML